MTLAAGSWLLMLGCGSGDTTVAADRTDTAGSPGTTLEETGDSGTSTSGGTGSGGTGGTYEVFFDDFEYASSSDAELGAFGWAVRTWAGGPGPVGASWSVDNITFHPSGDEVVMRLTATTDGTAYGSSQAEIAAPMKFLEGTYAARVRFTDDPVSGTVDGDETVEAFFAIAPWTTAALESYCEIDFEYLPNGGWGDDGPTLWNTTWEIATPPDNVSNATQGSFAGWQVLVFTVFGGEVRYYLNGTLNTTHGGDYYPESVMNISFQQWFISGGFAASAESRSYAHDVDWVFHARNTELSTAEVENAVAAYRAGDVARLDTVP